MANEREPSWMAEQMRDPEFVREMMQAAVREARNAALGEAAEVVEAYLHTVPDEGGDDLDRIGRYSNATVRNAAAAIRALKGE